MTLPLTPETLAGAYDYLKSTPPFCKWKLPESDEVVFKVGARKDVMGEYRWFEHQHTIMISTKSVGYSLTLLETMSHELIHLYLEHTNQESRNNAHSQLFRKLAHQVCRIHGFDPRSFY